MKHVKSPIRRLAMLLVLLQIMMIFSVTPVFATDSSSGTLNTGITWSLAEDGTCTISGSGAVTDSLPNGVPSIITSLVFGDGITGIGSYTFQESSATSCSMADSVTSIGVNAFAKNTSLSNLTLSNNLTSIGDCAFYGCSALTTVKIPSSVTSLAYDAFYGCTSLKEITIPASIEYLDNGDDQFDPFESSGKDLVIKGIPGSYAETLASEYGYKFEVDTSVWDTIKNSAPAVSLNQAATISISEYTDPYTSKTRTGGFYTFTPTETAYYQISYTVTCTEEDLQSIAIVNDSVVPSSNSCSISVSPVNPLATGRKDFLVTTYKKLDAGTTYLFSLTSPNETANVTIAPIPEWTLLVDADTITVDLYSSYTLTPMVMIDGTGSPPYTFGEGYASVSMEVLSGQDAITAPETTEAGKYTFTALQPGTNVAKIRVSVTFCGQTKTQDINVTVSPYTMEITLPGDQTEYSLGDKITPTVKVYGIGGTKDNPTTTDITGECVLTYTTDGWFSYEDNSVTALSVSESTYTAQYPGPGFICVEARKGDTLLVSEMLIIRITDENIAANVIVTDNAINTTIEGTYSDAESAGENVDAENKNVVINAVSKSESAKDISTVNASISTDAADSLADAEKVSTTTIKTNVADITFDAAALKKIADANDNVKLNISVTEDSTDSSALNISIEMYKDNDSTAVLPESSSSSNGTITVTVPYPGTAASGVAVYYKNGDALTKLDASYDSNAKTVTFTTSHFSEYLISQNLCLAGHSWETKYTVDKPASCTTEGSKSIHCANCIATKDPTAIPTTAHVFGSWSTVTSPNCTNTGSLKRTCSCGYTETKNVDASGHSWETDYTVDKEASYGAGGSKSIHCSKCEAVKNSTVIPALTNPFVDVTDGPYSYYYAPVLWALDNQVTKGTDETHFTPDGECTRAQVVTFLWRAAGSPKPKTSTSPFVDVTNSSEYYYDAVLWAAENGITTGTDSTHFTPDDTVTRAQFVTFLWRLAGKPASSTANSFTDLNAKEYYYTAVLWACDKGITNGTGNGLFSPGENCTRGQTVTFLYRYYQ